MPHSIQRFPTPIGDLHLVQRGEILVGLALPDRWPHLRPRLEQRLGPLPDVVNDADGPVASALRSYFDGRHEALEAIEVAPQGSEFQKRAWAALREIPVGSTVSYREIALRLGQPTAARAVATANATNPIAIVIPCHRVIHADGSISGFGGGVEMKRWLLQHEAAAQPFRLTPTC